LPRPNTTDLVGIDPSDCRFAPTGTTADEFAPLTVGKSLEVMPLVRVGRLVVVTAEIDSALGRRRDAP
jgi:hypothetical protein